MVDQRFRNIDYTDRELLGVIKSAGGDEGCTAMEIATRLGLSSNGKDTDPARRIGPRLAWMKRYRFLDQTDGIWTLTEAGNLLLGGKLSKAVETALEKMDPGSRILLTRALGQQTISARNEYFIAIRREWSHQMGQGR